MAPESISFKGMEEILLGIPVTQSRTIRANFSSDGSVNTPFVYVLILPVTARRRPEIALNNRRLYLNLVTI